MIKKKFTQKSKKNLLVLLAVSIITAIVLGVSMSAYSANIFSMKIEYENEVYDASKTPEQLEEKMFFNVQGETSLEFIVDLSKYFEVKPDEFIQNYNEIPFDVIANLEKAPTKVESLLESDVTIESIEKIGEGLEFNGRFKVKLKVAAGHDNDKLSVTVDIIENEVDINTEFYMTFPIIRDLQKPVINISGISNEGLVTDKVIITLDEQYKNTSSVKVTINDVVKEYNGNDTIEINETIDGSYIGKVEAKDKANNTADEKALGFYINTDAPEVTYNDESIKQIYNDGNIEIKISDKNKIDFEASKYSLYQIVNEQREVVIEEKEFTSKDANTGIANLKISNDGVYELNVKAYDKKDKESVVTNKFIVDTKSPIISIEGITNDGVYETDKLVTLKIEEENLAEVKINGTQIDISRFTKENNVYTYEIIEKTEENNRNIYSYDIEVKDKADNPTIKKSISYEVDKKNPVINFNVENDKHYNKDQNLNIEVSDDNIDYSTIKFEINRSSNDSEDLILLEKGNFESGILSKTLTDGKYSVTIIATDKLGNEAKESRAFVIDNNSPIVEVTGIENDIIYNGPVSAIVKVKEDWYKTNEVKVEIVQDLDEIINEDNVKNDLPEEYKADKVDYNQKYDFNKDGSYSVKVTARDKATNEVTVEEISFKVDKFAPKIEVTGVEADEHYNSDKTVNINILDANHKSNKVSLTGTFEGEEFNILDNEELAIDGVTASLKDLSITRNGKYHLVIKSEDEISNTESLELSFTIDKDAPIISIKDIDKSEDIVSGEHYDHFKNIQIKIEEHNFKEFNIEVFEDGKKISKEEDIVDFNYGKSLEIMLKANANYRIEASATDFVNDKKTIVNNFVIDTEKPVINILEYNDLNGEYKQVVDSINIAVKELNLDKESLSVEIIKTIPGEAPKTDVIKGNELNIETIDKENYQIKLADMFIKDAVYDITVSGKDIAKNELNEESKNKVSFTVDNTAPAITITKPENKTYYQDSKKEIEVNIDDNNHNINKVFVESVTKEIGEKEIVVTKEYTDFVSKGITKTFKLEVDEEALYKVTVYSEDKAINVSEVKGENTQTFVIDRSEPIIETNFAEINGTYNNPQKEVNIKVSELNWKNKYTGAPLSVSIKGTKQAPDKSAENIDLSFNLTNEITEIKYLNEFNDDAIYNLFISVNDITGKPAKAQNVTFVTDKTNPAISITGVEHDAYYNMDRPVVIRSVDVNHQINSINVTKDGEVYSIGDFTTEGRDKVAKHTFTREGVYEINVSSTDKAGNNTTHSTVRFTIDKTRPIITPMIKGTDKIIKNGEYINKIFTPEFKLDNPEDKIDTITLNGEGNYANSVPMASTEMVYTYKVVASDKANNITPLEITFTLDTTNPDVEINGILSGFFSKNMQPTYNITDTNLDQNKTEATLNGKPYESGTLISEQNHYNLKFVGTDLANNVTTKTITFAIDKDKPVIRFAEPISGEYFKDDFIPNFVIDDLTDYTIISMTLNGEDYELNEPITKEGKHVLFIEVKDKAGNIESISVEFILDKTPPKFIVEGIENNKKYYEFASAKIKLDNPQDKIKSVELNGELVTGDIKEEDGQQVISLNFNEIKSYELKLVGEDLAGNRTEEIINFEVAKKNIFVKVYQNKKIFYPTSIAIIVVVISLVISYSKKVKLKTKDNKEE